MQLPRLGEVQFAFFAAALALLESTCLAKLPIATNKVFGGDIFLACVTLALLSVTRTNYTKPSE